MKKLRKILAIVLACAMALCILTACSGGTGSGNTGGSAVSNSAEAKEIIAAVNAARKAAGKNELTESATLDKAAATSVGITTAYWRGEITEAEYQSRNRALSVSSTGNLFGAYHAGISFTGQVATILCEAQGSHIGCAVDTANGNTYYQIYIGA